MKTEIYRGMKEMFKDFRFTPSVISLLIMNLIPLVGVFWFGWDAGTIVFLYWLENVIIGILNIPKILAYKKRNRMSRKPHQPIAGADRFTVPEPQKGESLGGMIFLVIFFIFHYGMFCFGHYAFLRSTYRTLPGLDEFMHALVSPVLFWSLLGLTLSHLISMYVNFYGKGEYKNGTANGQMFRPYSRIVLLHIVIILSGFLAIATGQGLATLLLLIVFKVIFDLAAHTVEHSEKDSLIAPSVS